MLLLRPKPETGTQAATPGLRPARARTSCCCVAWAALLAALLGAGKAGAGQTRRFVLDTPHALASSTSQGVAVFPDGSLRPLPPLVEVAAFDEPLGLAMVPGPAGAVYVATGHPARVFRVQDGKKEEIGAPEADQVTALLLAPDGDLWVATAVPAMLLRAPRGVGPLVLASRLAEGTIWDLVWYRGELVAAAGNPGRVLRLTARGLELAVSIADRHARCLAVAGESLLIGTSGQGRVLSWAGVGPAGVLYDSPFTEIAALAPAPGGVLFAAALTGDPGLGKPAAEPTEGGGSVTVTVTVSEGPPATPAGEKGSATSEILRILPTGAVTTVHRFNKQLAGTLAWGEGGLLIGTGLEGEIWQLVEGAMAQLDTVDAAQVVRLAGGGRWALTQSPVRLLERRGEPRGVFTSPPLDAGQPAQWGEAELGGQLPAAGRCTLRARSGASATPDETWSDWTAAVPCGAGRITAPPARYLQWQVELEAPAALPVRLERVQIAYRQLNLPPEIRDLLVHEPGEVFLKSPPPAERIVEVQHPDLSGIFTTLDGGGEELQERLGKRYYRIGYQSVSWKVEDPNGDPLRFALEIQRSGGGQWWKVRDELETVTLALDTHALPDGLYRFRLLATDAPANPEAPGTVQALSSWITVDNTAPRLTAERRGGEWVIEAEDTLSPLALAEWNQDAAGWRRVAPEDGLLDGRRERFRIPAPGGRHILTLRVVDNHHNHATIALEETP
ncbi:MAG: fibronectin type III domain-containing protein [Acidobacteriota bacterium]